MLPVKHVYIAVAIIVLALVGGLYLHAYISDRLATQHYNDIKKSLADSLADKIGEIKQDHEDRKTPEQIAQGVPKYFKGVHPVVFHLPVPTESSKINGTLPDAPVPQSDGSLLIPKSDVQPFWDNVAHCAETEATNATCQKQLKVAEETIKGGKWYTKVWRQTKPIICSSIGGGIAGAAGAKPTIIAATAAGAGTVCAIATK